MPTGGGEKVVVQTAESDAYQLQHIHELIRSYFCLSQNAAQRTNLQLAVKRNYTPDSAFGCLFFEYYVTFHAV
ncbi:MAG: hypothetical protein C5S52_06140 [ANME-2 cluster archaeon]|nr:hypothetical protein [ANME-2 cluster archaeon]